MQARESGGRQNAKPGSRARTSKEQHQNRDHPGLRASATGAAQAGWRRTHGLDADVVQVRHTVVDGAPGIRHHRAVHAREAVVQVRVPDRVRPPLAVTAVPLQWERKPLTIVLAVPRCQLSL